MNFASLNTNKATWKIDTRDFEFKKVSDVFAKVGTKVLTMHGVFTNTSKFGEQAVIILEKCMMNAPKNFVETAKIILDSKEMCDEINEKGVQFHIEKEHSKKYNSDYYVIKFEDNGEPVTDMSGFQPLGTEEPF